jgi:hypothetical protein
MDGKWEMPIILYTLSFFHPISFASCTSLLLILFGLVLAHLSLFGKYLVEAVVLSNI